MAYYPYTKETAEKFGIGCLGSASDYGPRSFPIYSFHDGVDLTPTRNSGGDIPIIATVDGYLVNRVDQNGGLYCYIRGNNGEGHLTVHHKKFLRKEGPVKTGQEIALMGSTGHSTGIHTHYTIRRNCNYSSSHYNPMPLIFYEKDKMPTFDEVLEWDKLILENGKTHDNIEFHTNGKASKLVNNTDGLTQDQRYFLQKLKEFTDLIPVPVRNTAWLDTVMKRYAYYLTQSEKF